MALKPGSVERAPARHAHAAAERPRCPQDFEMERESGRRREKGESEQRRMGWDKGREGVREEKNTPTTETGGWQRETRGCENPNCVIFTAGVWGDNYKVTPEGGNHFLVLNLCKSGGLDPGKVFPHGLLHYLVWNGHCQFIYAQHNKSGVVSLFHPEVQKQQFGTIRHHCAEQEAIKMIMNKLYRVFDPALEGVSNISFTICVHTGEKCYHLHGNASVFYGKPVSSVSISCGSGCVMWNIKILIDGRVLLRIERCECIGGNPTPWLYHLITTESARVPEYVTVTTDVQIWHGRVSSLSV